MGELKYEQMNGSYVTWKKFVPIMAKHMFLKTTFDFLVKGKSNIFSLKTTLANWGQRFHIN